MRSNDTLDAFHCFLGTKTSWAITLFIAALGAYLLWAHTGHLVSALPYVIFLLCPLIHLFGHRHGRGHHRQDQS
ncbi:MAG: DUF2933 domain-containing protein [Byssovorax cruenta]